MDRTLLSPSGAKPPSRSRGDKWELLYDVLGVTVKLGLTLAVYWYVAPAVMSHLRKSLEDDGGAAAKTAEANKNVIAKKLKRDDLENLELTKYEAIIANDIVEKDSSSISFESIGGLEKQIAQIRESIVMPFKLWKMFAAKGKPFSYPSGMLLYGKPGTGKTLCVQALINETEASLISVKASTLMDKYFGESPKLVTSLFSLARKLAPCIIFIDEIDTLLPKRSSGSGSEGWRGATDSVQGAFLAQWDGLQSEGAGSARASAPVIVIGATNKYVTSHLSPSCLLPCILTPYRPQLQTQ